MSPDPDAGSLFLGAAIEAVLKAGEVQLAHLKTGVHISAKGRADIVTNVDIEVETLFRAMIAERFPEHGVLAEELAESKPDHHGVPHRWLFDPVDGTANYAHGLPFFCASLALEINGTIEVAAVYAPSQRELFTATRGRGAQLNGQPLRVSGTMTLADAMVGTGFPHGAAKRADALVDALAEFAISTRAVRRLGSAALDLCYVAAGRLDGFWDKNLKAWDTAAGALIVQEAGGTVSALNGDVFQCDSGQVLASNAHLHEAMLRILLTEDRGPGTEDR